MAQSLKQRFRPAPHPSLGLRVMSILGVFAASILLGFTASAVYFVNRVETIAWQGRQGEAARNAAGVMAAIVNRAQDALGLVSFIHADSSQPDSAAQATLNDLLARNPNLEEVVRLGANGQIILQAHRTDAVLGQLITIPQSRWFLAARSGQTYLGPVELSYNIQPYLLLAMPAPEGGVVAARVQIDALWSAVADIRFGEAGRAYVVTRSGAIVAHTDTAVVLAGVSIVGRPELQALLAAPNNEWHGAYTNFQGEPVVGATAPIPNTNWVVITELPRAEAFAASRTALTALGGGLLIVTVGLMWAAASAIERLVIRPMGLLRAGAARLGQGDLAYRIGLTQQDEIGQLAQAFDQMAADLGQRAQQVAARTAALGISEARYRAIVEDQTELICRYQPDGTLTFVNEAYCRYFGQPRDALVGHAFVPLIPAEDQPLVEAFVASLGLQNPVAALEHRVILPDGQVRWQHWTDRVILDAGGRVVEYQAVGQDITERRTAELSLRASEEQLRRITDNMFDVISQVDTTGMIAYASPSHQWVLGFDPATVIGQPIFARLHPDDLDPAMTAFMEAMQGGGSHQTIAFRYRHAAGHYVWMEAVSNFIFDGQGQVSGVILSSRDVTARLQMEAARRESDRLYRLLAENSTDVIWVRDLNLRLTYISPSIYKLRGFTADEALQQGLAETLAPGSVEAALESFAGLLAEQETVTSTTAQSTSRRVESEMLRKDGTTVWAELVMSPLFDTQGRPSGFQGVTRDISERRAAAEALQRANLELEDRVRARTADLVRVNQDLTAEVFERQRAEGLNAAFAALGRQLSSATTPAAAAEVILATADKLLGWDVCFLDLYQAEHDRMQTALAIDTVNGRRIRLPVDNALHAPSATLRKVMRDGGQLIPAGIEAVDWSAMEMFGDGDELPASLLFVPVRRAGQIIGCLSIQSYARQAYDQAGLELLEALADHCSGALERIRIETRVRASLHEKEVLLKEIHHRVKNNLQIISSLLNLQAATTQDRQTVGLLRDSQSRVKSMALVHEKLYQSPDLARISFAEYARSLTAQLFRTYSTVAMAVALELDVAEVWLSTDEAIPCGLIINELVSNALKHAFPNGREGVIALTVQSRADGRIELQVSDTGVGFPPGFKLEASPSLGLKLVSTLVDQLGGAVQVTHGAGTTFSIVFSRPAHAA